MNTMTMKVNYQLKLEEMLQEIKRESKIPKLLLHACCAPCSSYVLEYLSEYFSITILYYNPNIYPLEEYQRRMNELKNYIGNIKTKYPVSFMEANYNPSEYYHAIEGLEQLGERSKRCYHCYLLRMNEAARMAKNNHFDYFTTTLSISPYKNSDWINEIGKNLEDQYHIHYLYADFKKHNGYKRSLELSKQYNLYRQDYCGCEFSYQTRRKLEQRVK